MLEESPIPSTNEEPVLFDTAEVPWWAWIRRFHLPEVRNSAFNRKAIFTEIPQWAWIWRIHLPELQPLCTQWVRLLLSPSWRAQSSVQVAW